MEEYFCKRHLGLHPQRSLDIFHHYDYEHFNRALVKRLRPKDVVCNHQLDKMYARRVRIVELARIFDSLLRLIPGLGQQFIHELPEGDPDQLFDRCPPQLSFTDEEESLGNSLLREMGIEQGAPYVCFHSRDGGYIFRARPRITTVFGDWERREERNSSIENYLPAADYLAELGYYAVRVGKFVENPIPSVNERVIDYSTLHQSDFMDIFLLSHCSFYLAQDSGLQGVPLIFRKPIAFVNIFPLHTLLFCTNRPNIFIPKLFYSDIEGRFLTLREMLSLGLGRSDAGGNKGIANQQRLGCRLVENTAEEIQALADEMHQTLLSGFQTSAEDDENQARFLSIISSHLEYIDMKRGREEGLKIGSEFLRRHPGFLD